MPEPQISLKAAKVALSRIRSFSLLWLKLVCLVGFVVLIGGPWIIRVLQGIFGPAAAWPGRVITLDMIFTLPVAIFLWIQEHRLAEGEMACPKCGEHYPKTNAACPMCGSTNPANNTGESTKS